MNGRSLAELVNPASTPHDNEDMFDFVATVASLLSAIRLNLRLVYVTVVLVLAAAVVYQLVWPPIYTTDATITEERSDDEQRDAFYKEWNLFRKGDARTEIELMKAGAVLRAVIEKEHLTYDDVYHPLMSQIGYFWDKSWPGRAYKATKAWIFGPVDDGLTEEEREIGKTIKDMKAGFSVETKGDVLVGTVHARGPSPRIAQITNTWIDSYMEWRRQQHLDEAQKAIEALDQQIDEWEKEVSKLSQERVAFLNKHGLVFDFTKETEQVDVLVKLETEIAASRTRMQVVTASLEDIEAQLEMQPQSKVVSSVTDLNKLRDAAETRRLELQAALVKDQYLFKPDSPEVKLIQSQIEALSSLIESSPPTRQESVTSAVNPVRAELLLSQSSLKKELAGLRAGIAGMEQTRNDLREHLSGAPALAAQLRDLDRRYSVAQQAYDLMMTKAAQARASLSSAVYAMPSLRVVDYARPPSSKSWPKARYLYPAALLLGVVLGALAAWIKASFGGRVSQLHFQQHRLHAPLYAVLPAGGFAVPQMQRLNERRALPRPVSAAR